MRWVEVAALAISAAGGVRSAWTWLRRPFPGADPIDHLLYAMFVAGRVGLWFAFGGLFALYLTVDTEGRAFVDDVQRFRWYLLVLLGLSAMQFVGGQLLARRSG